MPNLLIVLNWSQNLRYRTQTIMFSPNCLKTLVYMHEVNRLKFSSVK